MFENIHIGEDSLAALGEFLKNRAFDKMVVLTDDNTYIHCYPLVEPFLPPHRVIKVKSGEIHKNLQTCEHIWEELTDQQLSRWSLLLNLGGGVIGDMGGFCAGVFKRGIYFVQIPTTLLSQVDASVGGKTGIDFRGFKNHLGVFQEPLKVFIYPGFLQTLPLAELKSGYAEIIKHWLIRKKESFDTQKNIGLLTDDWTSLITESVGIKAEVVAADPLEKGLRKILNFGHTVGHALETYRLEKPGQALLHGEAIAVGMICESYLSQQRGLLTPDEVMQIELFISSVYEKVEIAPDSIPAIAALALQDKKNTGSVIKCTLLQGIGNAVYDQVITLADIQDSLHYYRSL
ncbi:3-dehydroquinate synthase [Adhaeribacter aerolatus]|uniref:3-dehydroquinate synthase n=1 Tax=Adhaeribacter aerolatus TaxID=670289 RepID=A0A512B1N8_9BACT|nr:3-dehydroquinate synthase [Adhaeribacter aerolatus]GEO05873.1 3-dehydroquinate synthase [Adhaeribacter aerolatus]